MKPVSAGIPARRVGGTGVHWGGCSSRMPPALHLVLFALFLVAVNKILVALSEEEGKLSAATVGCIQLF